MWTHDQFPERKNKNVIKLEVLNKNYDKRRRETKSRTLCVAMIHRSRRLPEIHEPDFDYFIYDLIECDHSNNFGISDVLKIFFYLIFIHLFI